jgi:hypothetical protein
VLAHITAVAVVLQQMVLVVGSAEPVFLRVRERAVALLRVFQEVEALASGRLQQEPAEKFVF